MPLRGTHDDESPLGLRREVLRQRRTTLYRGGEISRCGARAEPYEKAPGVPPQVPGACPAECQALA
jgi:hypothetical protein